MHSRQIETNHKRLDVADVGWRAQGGTLFATRDPPNTRSSALCRSCQASTEHFEQCVEFALLRNRGLGPLSV